MQNRSGTVTANKLSSVTKISKRPDCLILNFILNMLLADSADDRLMIFFLLVFFLEKRI